MNGRWKNEEGIAGGEAHCFTLPHNNVYVGNCNPPSYTDLPSIITSTSNGLVYTYNTVIETLCTPRSRSVCCAALTGYLCGGATV